MNIGAESEAPQERTYLDPNGARWQDFEQPFADYGRRTGRSPIFASDAAVRRVRDNPANWMSLTDAVLAALSWKS